MNQVQAIALLELHLMNPATPIGRAPLGAVIAACFMCNAHATQGRFAGMLLALRLRHGAEAIDAIIEEAWRLNRLVEFITEPATHRASP